METSQKPYPDGYDASIELQNMFTETRRLLALVEKGDNKEFDKLLLHFAEKEGREFSEFKAWFTSEFKEYIIYLEEDRFRLTISDDPKEKELGLQEVKRFEDNFQDKFNDLINFYSIGNPKEKIEKLLDIIQDGKNDEINALIVEYAKIEDENLFAEDRNAAIIKFYKYLISELKAGVFYGLEKKYPKIYNFEISKPSEIPTVTEDTQTGTKKILE